MKKIHLNRDRQNLGEFSVEEVLQGLKEGRFLPTDLAWHVGMDAWRPLGEIRETLEVGATAPEAATEASTQSAQSAQQPATGSSAFSLEPASASSDAPMPAWEERQKLGIIPATIESIRQILTQPGKTFSNMPRSGGFLPPLYFHIFLSWLGVIAASIYQGIWFMVNPAALEKELNGVSLGLFWAILAGILIIMPIVLAALAFISTGILHVLLMITGGARHSFETTFRVYCYSAGAAGILQLIPFCGGVIYSVWYLICVIIGLAKAHETETWKSALAVLLPVLLCCGIIIAIMLFGVAAATGAAGAAASAIGK